MLAKARLNSYNENKRIVDFDLEWENSWKNDINFDGVYVFFKYKKKDEFGYKSMKTAGGYSERFEAEGELDPCFDISEKNIDVGIYAPNTQLGFFVYPKEYCKNKKIELKNIKIPVIAEDVDEIEIFTVEMVYIPEGGFKLGDPKGSIKMGGSSINGFYTYPDKPMYEIKSEDEIELGEKDGCLYYGKDRIPPKFWHDDTDGKVVVIPKEYPKGYKEMWYMKHPLTQAQWVQFLNCLTRKQQQKQVLSDISGDKIENNYAVLNSDHSLDRNNIFCRREGNGTVEPVKFYTNEPYRLTNGMNWFCNASFACFAGLRPISELEFIKAARGPEEPKNREYAWGTSDIGYVWNVDYDFSPLSSVKGKLANCNYNLHSVFYGDKIDDIPLKDFGGPVFQPTFEKAPVLEGYSERVCKGAGYYGVMELTGCLWECVVSVNHTGGRSYKGTHGTGELTEEGEYNVEGWPSVKDGIGFSNKGGIYGGDPNFYIDARPFAGFNKPPKFPIYHGGLRVGF